MNAEKLPVGLTTAALLKAQLDQGRDYFDLLIPFVERVLAKQTSEMVHPQQFRESLREMTSLQVPLRTVTVLLNRLTRAKKLRKEAGVYFLDPAVQSELGREFDQTGITVQFQELGADFAEYASSRGLHFESQIDALEELAAFLDENGASLLLGDGRPTRKQTRKNNIVTAGFISARLSPSIPEGEILNAFLQGLILRRAVLLSDIATLQRRLDRVVVYLDTHHLLSLAGLYGQLDWEASREGCRVLRSLGAIPAAFDITLAEMRRVLAVYENRIDTASGRAALDYTPLTRYFFSIRANGSDIRMRSSLLEVTLAKEGVVIHDTPARIAAHVEDENSLAEALKDVRGPQYARREQHDVDCVAAVLTLRRGVKPSQLEEARAIFAASGRVVASVNAWWIASGYGGIPPIIDYNALLNYCWLKRPSASTAMLRYEMAALCAEILRPSKEAWKAFVDQLQKMVSEGLVDSDEAAALVIDDLSAKYVVDAESSETMEAASMVQVIDRLRTQQRLEITEQADELRAVAAEERSRLQIQLEELRRSSNSALAMQAAAYDERLAQMNEDVTLERARAEALGDAVERFAGVVASLISYSIAGGLVLVVVVTAVFPAIENPRIPTFWETSIKIGTAVIAILGGLFGFAAVPAFKALRNSIKGKLLGTAKPSE